MDKQRLKRIIEARKGVREIEPSDVLDIIIDLYGDPSSVVLRRPRSGQFARKGDMIRIARDMYRAFGKAHEETKTKKTSEPAA